MEKKLFVNETESPSFFFYVSVTPPHAPTTNRYPDLLIPPRRVRIHILARHTFVRPWYTVVVYSSLRECARVVVHNATCIIPPRAANTYTRKYAVRGGGMVVGGLKIIKLARAADGRAGCGDTGEDRALCAGGMSECIL